MRQSNPIGTLFLLVITFLMIVIIIKLIPVVTFLVDFILSLL